MTRSPRRRDVFAHSDGRHTVSFDLPLAVAAFGIGTSAAVGHILFGDFQLALTTSLLVGSIPGVWLGAHLSARAPGGLVRRALGFVLLASAPA